MPELTNNQKLARKMVDILWELASDKNHQMMEIDYVFFSKDQLISRFEEIITQKESTKSNIQTAIDAIKDNEKRWIS